MVRRVNAPAEPGVALGRDRASLFAEVRSRVLSRRPSAARKVDTILEEVGGGFAPALHGLVMTCAPPLLRVAFSPPGRALTALRGDEGRLQFEGPVQELRRLAERGTLLIAPTHSSNLDSLVLGLALDRAGLPPCVYAVGEHLFRNPLVALLVRNLGGYRLDRGRADPTYWAVVQEYSTVLLERGLHSVVFPGGTRNRSNEVESSERLKRGLLGTGLRAQHGATARPVFAVPVTINYLVVLEAEWLVHYELTGRAHERVVGDELLRPDRLPDSARRLRRLEQRVLIRFGEALPLAAYAPDDTRRLAADLASAYRQLTTFMVTHVAARAVFDVLAARAGTEDVHRLAPAALPLPEVLDAVARTKALLGHAAATPAEVLAAAARAFGSCHPVPPFEPIGDQVQVKHLGLLYFYRNRSRHLG